MSAEYRAHLRRNGPRKIRYDGLLVKQYARSRFDLHIADSIQRSHNRVVLITGYNDTVAGPHQRLHRNIQRMGSVESKHHIVLAGNMKESRRFAAAAKGRFRRQPGFLISAAARRGHIMHGPLHSGSHSARFLERSGRRIQIDHNGTSV